MKIALLEGFCESQGAGGVWQLEVNDALSLAGLMSPSTDYVFDNV